MVTAAEVAMISVCLAQYKTSCGGKIFKPDDCFDESITLIEKVDAKLAELRFKRELERNDG